MRHPLDDPEAARLDDLIRLLRGRRTAVLAGAGCSTESGIPDYRGPEGSLRTRKPMQYQEFLRGPGPRARYWARSAVGWTRFSAARPNAAHRALARLEEGGAVAGVITQNVDGLHQAAGSRAVVELHGSLARVRCLDCGRTEPRDEFQGRLLERNRAWAARLRASAEGAAFASAPDGDVELPAWAIEDFVVPGCGGCAGVLKPDVVFFGESVPAERVAAAWALYERADVLLVAGSSLAVYSGRRFVDRARREGREVAVVNLGPTRADDVAAVKVEARLGDVLPRVAGVLAPGAASFTPAGPR